jgi:hypothetical protein
MLTSRTGYNPTSSTAPLYDLLYSKERCLSAGAAAAGAAAAAAATA